MNKDILTLLALKLDLKTLYNFSLSCVKFSKVLDEIFWITKLKKDFDFSF
jgi:hypothetical protein